jgi:hypothetical protein
VKKRHLGTECALSHTSFSITGIVLESSCNSKQPVLFHIVECQRDSALGYG